MDELLPAVARDIRSIAPRESYESHTIPDALTILRDYVDDKAPSDASRPHLKLGRVLTTLRDYKFLATLLADCEEWLKFFYFSSLCRASLYLREVTSGFNERALLRVPLATRALVELFLYTFHVYKTVYRHQTEAKALPAGRARDAIAIQIKERDFLMKQASATRVNWDDPFGSAWAKVRDDVWQTNVLSLIPKLPADQRGKVERWYALLSDACHPNFGSVLFVLDHERLEAEPQPVFPFTTSNGLAHLQLVVDLVTAPLGFTCVQLVGFWGQLERIIAHYRNGVLRFKDR